jgi:hypothetical protein
MTTFVLPLAAVGLPDRATAPQRAEKVLGL